MSLRYLVAAFAAQVGNPSRKLVLLKLADNANDSGVCWPSLQYVAEQTELSRDSVKRHIKDLEAAGMIKITRRSEDGVNLPSVYELVGLHPFVSGKSEEGVGAGCTYPVQDAPRGRCIVPLGVGAGCTPNHTSKPSTEPLNNKGTSRRPGAPQSGSAVIKKPHAHVERPEGVGEQVWGDFLALRKSKRAPLTETALSAIRAEAAKAGITLEEALKTCCMRGWQGFRADWVTSTTAAHPAAPRVMAPRTVEPDWSKMDYGEAVQAL